MKKLLNKVVGIYKGLSAPVRATLWFTVCSVAQKGISLLTTPIFTRLLSSEQYGRFSVYQSWYAIISIVATLNLFAGVYNNGLTKYPDKRDELTASFQGLSTTVTAILLLVYLINVDFWNGLLKMPTIFVLAMFVEMLFVPAYSYWTVGQRYDYKYKGIIVVTLVLAMGSPIISVIAVLSTEHKAEARVLSFALVQAAVGIVFYIYNIYKGKRFFSAQYWKFALSFNLPLIPHYLSMTLLNQSDRIMISRMVGESEAAIYSVAYTISMLMNIITNAINNSFIPYTYKSLKEKKYDGIRTNANFLLILVGGASVLAMAFGPELVKIVGTEEYYDAIWIIPPVAASVYFMFLYPLFGNVEFFFEKTKFVMVASCIGAAVNLVLNYIFIPIFGYYAAGYTTLFCYILFAVAHYFFHMKTLRMELPELGVLYNTRFILLFSAVVLAAMVGMVLTYKWTLVRYSIIAVLCVVAIVKRKLIVESIKALKK